MGLLKGLAVSILTFSFIVFVALFGRVPAFRYVLGYEWFLQV